MQKIYQKRAMEHVISYPINTIDHIYKIRAFVRKLKQLWYEEAFSQLFLFKVFKLMEKSQKRKSRTFKINCYCIFLVLYCSLMIELNLIVLNETVVNL
jgi:hypothetical protein